jgi:hypothetical protein
MTIIGWSYDVAISKGNKENVVVGMANLSIMDHKGSRTLTYSSNKPNVPSKPQKIGHCTDTNLLPLAKWLCSAAMSNFKKMLTSIQIGFEPETCLDHIVYQCQLEGHLSNYSSP